jgi:hypothetical protein
MNLDEELSELDLLGSIERAGNTPVDGIMYGPVDLRVRVAEHARSDPHQTHVDVAMPVEVDDLDTASIREVGGPEGRKKHLRTFGEELCPPGNELLGSLVESGPGHVCVSSLSGSSAQISS